LAFEALDRSSDFVRFAHRAGMEIVAERRLDG
jgi:hypothetical protein